MVIHILVVNKVYYTVADPGGGGSRGSGPLFGPRCRLFNIGPKVGPPLGPPFLLVDLRWTPVADPGCVCDRGDHPHPLGMWMTSHGQCPRGVCACECPRVGVFFNFSEGG